RRLSLIVFCAVVLVVVVPATSRGQGAPRLAIPYTQFTLGNGLDVILHEDHSVPLVAVDAWYHVGSAREKPGRTGFAHLFEHIMFEGSGHVPEGDFDNWLEAAGGDNNGSTDNDRTNYWETVPSNALELALFLESDRMGYLLNAMGPEKVNGQRDVVKNERRQSYENRPYGVAFLKLPEEMYPPTHPYHWPVIGSMEDLTAASYEDVVQFFKSYYGPNNTTLVVAGDIDPVETRRLVEKWFSDVPRGAPVAPLSAPPAVLAGEKRITLEDKVQLPQLFIAWHTPPYFHPGDEAMDVLARVLASGKNSRLYKRLVYDLQIAQDVSASQNSGALGSMFLVTATAREGHGLSEIEKVIGEELAKLESEPPAIRELERAVNQIESAFYGALERVGGFGGKADRLNLYEFYTGRPDYFTEDLARYTSLDPRDLQSTARTYLRDDARVVLSVVPTGKKSLAAEKQP
ncbi:MAG TPA: pitrilysin family protein, partial [Thermoanaerobaculia bacterium]|nr:pitrilysin family protein [Thermoanaerobaculia bacterium]